MFGNLCKWFPILFVWNLSTLKKPANMISLYLKPKSMPTPQNPHSLLPLVFTLRKCHLSSNSTRPLHDETHIIHIYQYIDIYSRCSTFSNDARVSSGLPHGSRSHTPSCDFATQPNEASEFAVSSWLFTHLNISQQVQYSARSTGLRVFCVGNSCFLRRWLVFVFFATVPVGGVFCNGGGCFLRRSWWEGMFFATAGHVFCIGRVCFLRWWCFLRR